MTLMMIPVVAAISRLPFADAAPYAVMEMATPNALPKELAILYTPAASPTLSEGALDTDVSVDGVA